MTSKGTAIVTGAAQGIGHAIALRLGQDGYNVAVNDLAFNSAKLEELAKDIEKGNGKALVFTGDVSNEAMVMAMIAKVVGEWGGLDVMVANAGIMLLSILEDQTVDAWDRVMSVNVKGAMICFKHAAKQMIQQGKGGRIIGASSMNGKKGSPIGVAYSASKFAIRGLVQSSAMGLGKHGITVNAYAPGPIDTALLSEAGSFMGLEEYEFRAKMENTVALKRLGTPEDIAGLVSFLVSPDARFITGQTYNICGGIQFD